MVVVDGVKHVVDGIVFIADATEHETSDLSVDRNLVVSVGVGHHAFVDDLPIHINARKRRALAIFGLFIYSAFDEALGESACGEDE